MPYSRQYYAAAVVAARPRAVVWPPLWPPVRLSCLLKCGGPDTVFQKDVFLGIFVICILESFLFHKIVLIGSADTFGVP